MSLLLLWCKYSRVQVIDFKQKMPIYFQNHSESEYDATSQDPIGIQNVLWSTQPAISHLNDLLSNENIEKAIHLAFDRAHTLLSTLDQQVSLK